MNLYDIAVARKLSGGGGGGESSDFSTAEVTIVNNTEYRLAYSNNSAENCPYIENVEDFAGVVPYIMTDIEGESSLIVNVPLYKGMCIWDGTRGLSGHVDNQISVSGDIVNNDGGFISITGNGTITISSGILE